ncbi:hypothetical protein D3C85_1348030 [compost metagenome]
MSHKICPKPVSDNWNVELIDHFNQLSDLSFVQELSFIDQNTIRTLGLREGDHIQMLVDNDGSFLHTDSGSDLANTEAIVHDGSEEKHLFALLLIIMSNAQDFNRFTAVHCAISKIQFSQTGTVPSTDER